MGRFALASFIISMSRFTSSLSHPGGGRSRFFGGMPAMKLRLSKRHAPIFPGVKTPFLS